MKTLSVILLVSTIVLTIPAHAQRRGLGDRMADQFWTSLVAGLSGKGEGSPRKP